MVSASLAGRKRRNPSYPSSQEISAHGFSGNYYPRIQSSNRRKFLKGSGMAGLGIASATLIGGSLTPLLAHATSLNQNAVLNSTGKRPTAIHDTPADILPRP